MKFVTFMSGTAGRTLRALVGLGLVWWGMTMQSGLGYGIAAFGVVAVLSGVVNFCIIAPMLGAPFMGKNLPKGPAATPNQSTK